MRIRTARDSGKATAEIRYYLPSSRLPKHNWQQPLDDREWTSLVTRRRLDSNKESGLMHDENRKWRTFEARIPLTFYLPNGVGECIVEEVLRGEYESGYI